MANKRGVSVVVGYVLLITFGIILSVLVYNYLKTYVPSDTVSCPDGISLLIKSYSYNCTSNQFNITLENNGKFYVSGYTIHATTNASQTLATYDLSNYYAKNANQSGMTVQSYILFNKRYLNVGLDLGKQSLNIFNLSAGTKIYSVEIIPARLETQGSSENFALCSSAQVLEDVSCNP